ncbi:MraY family glycosyltransferase [Luteolibacter luteus]|uniref:Undecaprenyl/decaprenyl-phosphate alpha-N-acetylglucosaminyl 1-phosphate transferase n=1 Tax=Luteolibacter luteus TaxID=2728835 RepID=A0A858RDP5_9BACT|nr:MraY family glycosyltransferase [Luteolibacter luteus]QJE94303.1 hypothetical protein HHL09_00385 [Luteolibacter luteus]
MSELFWSWIVIACALPVSMAMTRLMIHLGPKMGLVDHPGERRIHVKPIPRAGGLGLFITMAVGMLVLHWKTDAFSEVLGPHWLPHFMAGAVLLVLVGVKDDHSGVSAYFKLAVQAAAAVIMFFHNPAGAGVFMGYQIPWIIDLGIHVAWTVLLVNAFNLIDGMDGLCGGLAMIALLILTVLATVKGRAESAFVIALMAVALIGFLRYNFHPAKIFLGDTGSMLIGFFIASVGTSVVGRNAVVAGLLLPLLVGGVPLLDVALAVWRRAARRVADSKPGIKIFGPDRDHLHHRLLSWGFNQKQAAFLIYGLAIVTSTLALLPIVGGANLLTVSVVGLVIIALVGMRYLAPVEFLASGRGLRTLTRKPQSYRHSMLRYLGYDIVVLFSAAVLVSWAQSKAMIRPVDWQGTLGTAALFTTCSVVGLSLAKAHSRRWTRASAHDFAECGLWLMCGVAVSFALKGSASYDLSFRDALVHLSALTLGGLAVFAPRCMGAMLQESVIDTMHRKRRLRGKRSSRTTLLYGAGDLGELFLCHLRLCRPETWQDYHFVGFIDDSERLRGRRMRGFPILGGFSNLREVVARTRANSILITSSVMPEERYEEILTVARELGMEISRWQPEMNAQCLLEPTSFTPRPADAGDEVPELLPIPPRTVELRHA